MFRTVYPISPVSYSGKKSRLRYFPALRAVGVALGISYAMLYLLALNWWVVTIVVIVAGMSTGTFAFLGRSKDDAAGI